MTYYVYYTKRANSTEGLARSARMVTLAATITPPASRPPRVSGPRLTVLRLTDILVCVADSRQVPHTMHPAGEDEDDNEWIANVRCHRTLGDRLQRLT